MPDISRSTPKTDKSMTVEPYQPHLKPEWDMVVEQSRNGTFLHRRDYMDYHADRFEDMSLIARDDSGRIIAVMPAHRCGDTITSHGGLTYGGWLMTPRADMIAMTEVWKLMTALLADMGIARLIYRPVPHIYHKYPAEEDLYALWRAGGRLERTLVSSVIDLLEPLSFDMSARQSVRKAMRSGVTVRESDDWAGFWQVLEERLATAHGARPVHSLDEILLLRSRFPENIRLFTAEYEGEIVAGSVVYYTDKVAHSQYTGSTEAGRRLRSLPLLYRHIIDTMPEGIRYFDLGTSNEDAGRYLNEGLIRQKASYGARAVAFNSYCIDI